MSVGTFSPDSLQVVISNGDIDHIVTNFGEGTFINIEPASERFTPTVGAKGEEYRAHQPSKAVTVTFTLSQTSHSNDVLSDILDIDRDTKEGFFTMTIKDVSGTTVYTDEFSYIQTEPSQSFSGGGSIDNREWQVRMPKPSYNIGGNGKFSVDEINTIQNLGGTIDPRWT